MPESQSSLGVSETSLLESGPSHMPVALRAEHLAKAYRRHPVLRDVTLTVAPGSLVGIVGENGAGKSTLLRILAGELRPQHGRVAIAGSLGYCPQAVVLNDSLSVDQHLDYFRAAYDLLSLDHANALVERLGLREHRQAPAGTLSGGTRQKLNLVLALMHDPAVLLLDEPYQGFDWETYMRFWDIADDLRARGKAVLVISHLLFDQRRFDVLYELSAGQLVQIPPTIVPHDDKGV
jgi:ABC-2 type transport system ATP-binding protein